MAARLKQPPTRSEQPPARSEQPPKTQFTTQQSDPNGFCETDERKEEVWSRPVGGTDLWMLLFSGWRRWVLGEMGWWLREGTGLGCDL